MLRWFWSSDSLLNHTNIPFETKNDATKESVTHVANVAAYPPVHWTFSFSSSPSLKVKCLKCIEAIFKFDLAFSPPWEGLEFQPLEEKFTKLCLNYLLPSARTTSLNISRAENYLQELKIFFSIQSFRTAPMWITVENFHPRDADSFKRLPTIKFLCALTIFEQKQSMKITLNHFQFCPRSKQQNFVK